MDENTLQATDVAEAGDSTKAHGAIGYAKKRALKIDELRQFWARQSLLFLGFVIVATIVMPPDVISQLTLAVMMAIVYGLTSLAVSRFKLLADTAPLTKTVLIFLFSVALTLLVLFGL